MAYGHGIVVILGESLNPKKWKKDSKKGERKEKFLACILCEYKTKKEALLKKHTLTTHEDYSCKKCEEKFPSFIAL